MLLPKELRIVKYHNENIVKSRFQFRYEKFEEPKMKELCGNYNLSSVIANGKTEFEKILILRNWVNSRWKHGWSNSVPAEDAFEILERAEKGERFHCAYYSTVFSQCCIALGFQSRIIGICKKGIDFTPPRLPTKSYSHTTTEVWLNDFKKWAVMDPDLNAHYEYKGIPLNAYEIRKMWLNGRWREVKLVRVCKGGIDWYNGSPFTKKEINKMFTNFIRNNAMDHYRNIWIEMRNDYFSSKKPYKCLHWIDRFSVPRLVMMKCALDEHIVTQNLNDIYWTLNQTSINLTCESKKPSSILKIRFENSMPNFKYYLVKIDDGKWIKRPGIFKWHLHEGDNTIETKSLNKSGWEGIASSITVRYSR